MEIRTKTKEIKVAKREKGGIREKARFKKKKTDGEREREGGRKSQSFEPFPHVPK